MHHHRRRSCRRHYLRLTQAAGVCVCVMAGAHPPNRVSDVWVCVCVLVTMHCAPTVTIYGDRKQFTTDASARLHARAPNVTRTHARVVPVNQRALAKTGRERANGRACLPLAILKRCRARHSIFVSKFATPTSPRRSASSAARD